MLYVIITIFWILCTIFMFYLGIRIIKESDQFESKEFGVRIIVCSIILAFSDVIIIGSMLA